VEAGGRPPDADGRDRASDVPIVMHSALARLAQVLSPARGMQAWGSEEPAVAQDARAHAHGVERAAEHSRERVLCLGMVGAEGRNLYRGSSSTRAPHVPMFVAGGTSCAE
jgi:hypothetical protein